MIKFPLAIIDFEASSLNPESFPIEVGLAVAHTSDAPIKVWSSLINPAKDWIARRDWDKSAADTHMITLAELAGGLPPSQVAETLNAALGPEGIAYSDGGNYDGHWLRTLYRAAGIKPTFVMWDIAVLFVLDRSFHNRFAHYLAASDAPHRAGLDARRICAALVAAV